MVDQVVVWSPEALDDVDDIARYIARDSAFYAAAVVEKYWWQPLGWASFLRQDASSPN